MTRTHTITQIKRSVGSRQKVETNGLSMAASCSFLC